MYLTLCWYVNTDCFRLGSFLVDERAYALDGTPEDLAQAPSGVCDLVKRITGIATIVMLGCVTLYLFDRSRARNRII